jgi:hypothetical protein
LSLPPGREGGREGERLEFVPKLQADLEDLRGEIVSRQQRGATFESAAIGSGKKN